MKVTKKKFNMSKLRKILSYNLFANVFVLRVLIILTITLTIYCLVSVAVALVERRGTGSGVMPILLLAFFGVILTRALKKVEKIGQKKFWKGVGYFFLVILLATLFLILGVVFLFWWASVEGRL